MKPESFKTLSLKYLSKVRYRLSLFSKLKENGIITPQMFRFIKLQNPIEAIWINVVVGNQR